MTTTQRPGPPPSVSVVVATFNRGRALRCAIESLRRQTVSNWEAIVVGDACTDDTAAVVTAFDDDRLKFINLTRNFGDQSGPNNVGVAHANADVVAYLNHDDLWLPDHLEISLQALDAQSADLVFSANANVVPPSDRHGGTTIDADEFAAIFPIVIDGLGRRGHYDPGRLHGSVPASSWLVRRHRLLELGGWRPASECVVEPSQDLLFRAHRAGWRMVATGALTVITIPSGIRTGSYVSDEAREQETLLPQLNDPALRARLLAADPTSTAAGAERATRAIPLLRRLWWGALRRLAATGLNPRAVDFRLRGRFRRGAYVNELRRRRGLAVTSPPADTVERLRHDEATRQPPYDLGEDLHLNDAGGRALLCLARGWSRPEPWGIWNDGDAADLLFVLKEPTVGPLRLVCWVVPHIDTRHPRQRVVVEHEGSEVCTWVLTEAEPREFEVVLEPAGRSITIRFRLPDGWSPGEDPRRMALGLLRVRLEAC